MKSGKISWNPLVVIGRVSSALLGLVPGTVEPMTDEERAAKLRTIAAREKAKRSASASV